MGGHNRMGRHFGADSQGRRLIYLSLSWLKCSSVAVNVMGAWREKRAVKGPKLGSISEAVCQSGALLGSPSPKTWTCAG
jgi:hypothetical protein